MDDSQDEKVVQIAEVSQQQLLELIVNLAKLSLCNGLESDNSDNYSFSSQNEGYIRNSNFHAYIEWQGQEIPILLKPPTKETYRQSPRYQEDAVIYIVVVLLFYSITIATLMIKYMRKQAEDDKDARLTQEVLQNSRRLAKQQEKMDTAARLIVRLTNDPKLSNSNLNHRTSVQFQRYIESNRRRLAVKQQQMQQRQELQRVQRPSISIQIAPPNGDAAEDEIMTLCNSRSPSSLSSAYHYNYRNSRSPSPLVGEQRQPQSNYLSLHRSASSISSTSDINTSTQTTKNYTTSGPTLKRNSLVPLPLKPHSHTTPRQEEARKRSNTSSVLSSGSRSNSFRIRVDDSPGTESRQDEDTSLTLDTAEEESLNANETLLQQKRRISQQKAVAFSADAAF